MPKYRVKPNDVEAVRFTDSKTWYGVEKLLGPHLVRTSEDKYQVYDIAKKEWLDVHGDEYVVKKSDGSVEVWSVKDFENRWEPEPSQYTLPGTVFPQQPGIYAR